VRRSALIEEPGGHDLVSGLRLPYHPDQTMSNLLRILLAILLPPVGVLFTVGLGGAFWINILLTLLGYIPGIVHAVWVIARRNR